MKTLNDDLIDIAQSAIKLQMDILKLVIKAEEQDVPSDVRRNLIEANSAFDNVFYFLAQFYAWLGLKADVDNDNEQDAIDRSIAIKQLHERGVK